MGDYADNTQQAVADATAWANESATLWLGTYVAMVDRASAGPPLTADEMAQNAATLGLAAQRDLARVANTWINLGTALVNLPLP